MDRPFVSATCGGERCRCGKPAVKKVGEEIPFDDPTPDRHNLTAYVCAEHYAELMGPLGAKQCGATRTVSPSPEKRPQRDAAYERGWVDSLRAYWNVSGQPIDDAYDYAQGWNECAKYRWADPTNNGHAPDPNYRKPRKEQP